MDEKVEHYLEFEIEDLYFDIGNFASEEKNALPAPFKKVVERGRNWVIENHPKLKSSVCGSTIIIHFKEDNDLSKLFYALADAILAQYTNVPAFSLSTLIIKIGVEKFCDDTSKIL